MFIVEANKATDRGWIILTGLALLLLVKGTAVFCFAVSSPKCNSAA